MMAVAQECSKKDYSAKDYSSAREELPEGESGGFTSLLERAFGRLLPKGLYARTLIIVIAPMVLLQSVIVFVFMERHWDQVTRRLSTSTVQDLSMLVSLYEGGPHDAASAERLTDLARQKMALVVQFLPGQDLPMSRPRPFFRLLDNALSTEIRKQIGKPAWFDTVGGSDHVEIRIKLKDAVMKALVSRSQTYASNWHIFLVWMVGTSLTLLAVAIMFLRNQIKPIQALAEAAESFGKGRPAPNEFRVRGAREVRQAAEAFIDMRNRIERHVEQRTTMLAGVSHDLRTVLTRFRLQVAMLGNSPGVQALNADVDDMQAMLEDYLAFAKGDSGEKTSRVDVREMLEEIQDHAVQTYGKSVTLDVRASFLYASLRRNSFKRAILNIVSNAARFAQQVDIRAENDASFITITVQDDGPGIPEDMLEEVFRPFFSLDDSRNQNVKSTGLGLAITRDIIRGHGGEITLHKSSLGGLKAVVRAPI
jgi:two-component system, OmpR family, osmolarity sensor histidine kinase EnvZ